MCGSIYTAIHQLSAGNFIENSKFLVLILIDSAYLKISIFDILFIRKKKKNMIILN